MLFYLILYTCLYFYQAASAETYPCIQRDGLLEEEGSTAVPIAPSSSVRTLIS